MRTPSSILVMKQLWPQCSATTDSPQTRNWWESGSSLHCKAGEGFTTLAKPHFQLSTTLGFAGFRNRNWLSVDKCWRKHSLLFVGKSPTVTHLNHYHIAGCSQHWCRPFCNNADLSAAAATGHRWQWSTAQVASASEQMEASFSLISILIVICGSGVFLVLFK